MMKTELCKWEEHWALEGQGGRGRVQEETKKGELRCIVHMCKLPTINVIITYFEHVVINTKYYYSQIKIYLNVFKIGDNHVIYF